MLFFRAAVIALLATLALVYVSRAEHDHLYLHHLEHRVDTLAARLDVSPWHAPPEAASSNAALSTPRPIRCYRPAAPPAPGTVLVDIERSSFERLLAAAGPHTYARQMPAHYHGPPVGYRLHGVRPDGLYAVLGLQDGDLVRSINGAPIASPDSLVHPGAVDSAGNFPGAVGSAGNFLGAVGSVGNFIDIELERHGTPMRIVVLIHLRQQ